MIYINESKYKQNSNARIGWIINEAAPDPASLETTKVVRTISNGRRVVGNGVIQTANQRNRNTRWYAREELFPQLTCPRTLELLKTGTMLGEAGHPMSQELQRQATIDPTNTIVRYLKFWTEGDDIWAEFVGTNNALGESFDLDLRDGILPAFSLRALGSVVQTNNGNEVRNIKVITWDNVIYPSHPTAYTHGLVSESAEEFVKTESGIYLKVNENMSDKEKSISESGILRPITNQSVIDCLQQESTNFNKFAQMFEGFYDSIKLVNEGQDVQLSDSTTGSCYVAHLESYVRNEILNYCNK